MLELVFIGVLAAHLVCMNVASAGPLLCAILDLTPRQQDAPMQPAIRFMARASIFMALAGLVLGIGLGWLQWNSAFREAVHRFSSRVQWGVVEFLFSITLMGGYAIWVAARPAARMGARIARSLVAVVASTNLLYHFPPLFSILAGTTSGSIQTPPVVTSAVFRQLLLRGDVLAISVHFLLASIAVSGATLIARGDRLSSSTSNSTTAVILGAKVALIATVLQIPAGLWLLMQLPGTVQQRLMGGDIILSMLLLCSVLGSFWLMHQLASMALGDVSRRTARRVVILMLAIVVLMTSVLQKTRPTPPAVSLCTKCPLGQQEIRPNRRSGPHRLHVIGIYITIHL